MYLVMMLERILVLYYIFATVTLNIFNHVVIFKFQPTRVVALDIYQI